MRLIISMLLFAAFLVTFQSPAVIADTHTNDYEDVISGDWDLLLNNQGETVSMSLKLKLEGENVSGNFESSTPLGNGQISGKWANSKIEVSMATSHATLTLTGTVKNGKLVGDWDSGHMAGKWEATRKKKQG